jgi:hypothetical protein
MGSAAKPLMSGVLAAGMEICSSEVASLLVVCEGKADFGRYNFIL